MKIFFGFLIIFSILISGCATVSPPDSPLGEKIGKTEIKSAGKKHSAPAFKIPEPTMPEKKPAQKPEIRLGSADKPVKSADNGYLVAAASRLWDQARMEMALGKYDQALSTVERAIRIDGENPELWTLMAKIQLKRKDFYQAEQLARKSNLLSAKNPSLRAENWRIIAAALNSLGKTASAKEAAKKAERLEKR